jgi:hypothetical protein
LSGRIREDQWLAELEKTTRKSDPGRTSAEIGIALGLTPAVVRVFLQRVRDLGRLVCGERSIVRIDGRANKVPVYTILRPARMLKAAKSSKR